MEGELTTLVGPEGEDWRVPVSELESRQKELASRLSEKGLGAALIQTPVDLYYYSGGRQNATLLVTSEGESRLFVRRSLARAQHESGGDDSPHSVESFPRMAAFAEDVIQQCNLGNFLTHLRQDSPRKLERQKTALKSCIRKEK